MKKVAIFVVGNRNSGKSTTIRALTGVGTRRRPYSNVRASNNDVLRAFVFHTAIQEMINRDRNEDYPPVDFLEMLERKYGVRREDYNVFIAGLELIFDDGQYLPERYIESMINQGFIVKVALVVAYWDLPDRPDKWPVEPPHDEIHPRLDELRRFLDERRIRYIEINTANDPNATGGRIRRELYP